MSSLSGHHYPNDTPFVELWCRSHFSFLRAASSPNTLLMQAKKLRYKALALTDVDGLYGMARAFEASKEQSFPLIVGAELTVLPKNGMDASFYGDRQKNTDKENLLTQKSLQAPVRTLVLHVENKRGYVNLCRILTESHHLFPKSSEQIKSLKRRQLEDKTGVYSYSGVSRVFAPRNNYAAISLSYLCDHAEGLWALMAPLPIWSDSEVEDLKQAFGGKLTVAIYRPMDGTYTQILHQVERFSARYSIAASVTNRVRYAFKEDKALFDVMASIREQRPLSLMGRRLGMNSEWYLKSPELMYQLFPNKKPWFDRSLHIYASCTFKMDELEYKFPHHSVGEDANHKLKRLSFEGAYERYGKTLPPFVAEQLERELNVIQTLDVASYFLSVKEIVDIARSKQILCQGRGSAANSAVCYCLGITAVDPSRSSLLFERFLSVERAEPPDIDVDFEHERREEIIQAIYEKYGRDKAAMVSEVICYRGRSALREVAKTFGFVEKDIPNLFRLKKGLTSGDRHQSVIMDRNIAHIFNMASKLEGAPRHLSIHVGGFVISSDDLVNVAPIEPATMSGRTVIPWDKDDLDSLGFFKIDILGLGILTAIRKAFEFCRMGPEKTKGKAEANDGTSVITGENPIAQLAHIPPEDPLVYQALQHADTVGVFQIESRAQMAMLPKLKPSSYYDLVIEVALVRPGPIQGGMVHPYLRRRRGEEAIDYPHPLLVPVLERTLGIPLFQEQVMQLAILGAGYTGGEADQLRRDMASWRRNGKLERHKKKLEKGFAQHGIPEEFSQRLYKQIHGFAEYGFPESHAASFALLVYASAWLKVHHPAAFAAALLNSQPMGFYSNSTILRDAERHGVIVKAPCVCQSQWDAILVEEASHPTRTALQVGFRQVKGLSKKSAEKILAARQKRGFENIRDFINQTQLDRDELDLLAKAGAFSHLEAHRRLALWDVAAPKEIRGGLFENVDFGQVIKPELTFFSKAENMQLDFEYTKMSSKYHPLLLLRPQLKKEISSAELKMQAHAKKVIVSGMVICRQKPQTASGVVFLTLEDEFGFINIVCFSNVFEAFRETIETESLLRIYGRLEREGEVTHVIAERVKPLLKKKMISMSRDFK